MGSRQQHAEYDRQVSRRTRLARAVNNQKGVVQRAQVNLGIRQEELAEVDARLDRLRRLLLMTDPGGVALPGCEDAVAVLLDEETNQVGGSPA